MRLSKGNISDVKRKLPQNVSAKPAYAMLKEVSKKALLWGVLIGIISVSFWNWSKPLAHEDTLVRNMETGMFDAEAEMQPVIDMFNFFDEKQVHLDQWTMYWRGELTVEEEDLFRQRIQKHFIYDDAQSGIETKHQVQFEKEVWTKEEDGTHHEITFIKSPKEYNLPTKYIYTWSSQSIHNNWKNDYFRITSKLVDELQQFPEIFACLEGFSNGKLRRNLSEHNNFDEWLTNGLNGNKTHRVSDRNFESITGYVSSWPQALTSDGQQINVQLSARYNELDDKTRITLGYPLILKEH